MAFYSIVQLQAKSVEELREIANELKTPNRKSDEKQTLVYDILDKQAETHSETKAEGTRQRRPRVSSRRSETLDNSANTVEKETSAAGNSEEKKNSSVEDAAEPQQPEVSQPVKRKRGRPSKAEIAAREAKENQEQERTLFTESNEGEATQPENEQSAPAEVILVPEKPTRKKSTASKAKKAEKDAQEFFVIRDVPIVEESMISDEAFETNTRTKFRRFKEDPLVQPVPKAAAVAREIEAQPSFNPESELIDGGGVLDIMNEGYGFLRSSDYNYLTSPDDIYVPANIVRSSGLKTGDVVEGKIRIPKEGEKFFCIAEIRSINGLDPALIRDRVAFEHLTPLFPDEKFKLCSGTNDPLSCRIVDLFAPIGKGQRALIVAQPKTGKTWLMKDIANAISRNHPDTYMMMLLIDERPEEVTDMARTVNAEVIASTFDEPASQHVKIANLVLEKAKRLVESGHDVVIFLDSITRLARAYNTVSPASGKVLTGGVEANSLQYPKRFFGAARNIEGGGSLTIIATALIDTGSKMDEVIFEEFKGTGNMELQLDRNLSNKRIFPSVNLVASSTRREDLLLDETTIGRMQLFRNILADMNPVEAMQELSRRMKNTLNNEEFMASMNG